MAAMLHSIWIRSASEVLPESPVKVEGFDLEADDMDGAFGIWRDAFRLKNAS